MNDTIFSNALKLIADTISNNLDAYKTQPGINISNWETQLVSNDETHYPMVVTLTLKDNKPLRLNIPAEFKPVTKQPNQTSGYIGDLRTGKISNPLQETMLLIGYFTGCLILGRIPSVINSGRGLLIEKLIKELNIVDFTLEIKEYSSGGKDIAHSLFYTFPQIKALIKFFSIRSNEIEKLEKKSGHTSGRVAQSLKRDNIKVETIE